MFIFALIPLVGYVPDPLEVPLCLSVCVDLLPTCLSAICQLHLIANPAQGGRTPAPSAPSFSPFLLSSPLQKFMMSGQPAWTAASRLK